MLSYRFLNMVLELRWGEGSLKITLVGINGRHFYKATLQDIICIGKNEGKGPKDHHSWRTTTSTIHISLYQWRLLVTYHHFEEDPHLTNLSLLGSSLNIHLFLDDISIEVINQGTSKILANIIHTLGSIIIEAIWGYYCTSPRLLGSGNGSGEWHFQKLLLQERIKSEFLYILMCICQQKHVECWIRYKKHKNMDWTRYINHLEVIIFINYVHKLVTYNILSLMIHQSWSFKLLKFVI